MKEIVIASNNQGKINDFKVIFPDYHVIGISELIPDFDVEETGSTFEENAILKSEAAAKALNKTVIADDSGLEVFALNGEPGIYSARYAGENKSDEANIEKLLNKLGNTTDRRAQFVCVISMSGPDMETKVFKGTVSGEIADGKYGENGFGYDPIFYVPKLDKTMAQLSKEQKGKLVIDEMRLIYFKLFLKVIKMSKWIIVSDNHTESGVLYQIYEMHPDADVYLHLGDSEFAYDDTELSLFNRVKGNCDFYPEFENEAVAKYNDVKAFYTHGHLYQVNRTRDLLAEKGLELGCLFAFYGHTHVAKYEYINGVHVINPGSISQSRSSMEETYAEVIIDDRTLHGTINFKNRHHETISHTTF